jgi:Arc/MetJ-type ribon-helix-helix transcriptional regulator
VVCAPAADAIADALRTLLAQRDDRSAGVRIAQDAWLAGHGWDAAADRVAKALGLWEQENGVMSADLRVRDDVATGEGEIKPEMTSAAAIEKMQLLPSRFG